MTSKRRIRKIIESDIRLVQLKCMSVEDFKEKYGFPKISIEDFKENHGFLKTSIEFAKLRKKEES